MQGGYKRGILRGRTTLVREAVVFFEDGAELVVGQGLDAVVVDAGHGGGGGHGVDDGFFGGLDDGGEDGFEEIVRKHLDVDHMVRAFHAGIGGGKGDEDVAGTVAGDGADATEAESDAMREAFELMGDEGRVGSNDDDDRAAFGDVGRHEGGVVLSRNFAADRNAGDAEILA